MSLLVTLITTQSFVIQVLNSAGFLPSNFLRPRMVLARLAPSLDSVMLVTPAAVLSKGCKLLKGTLETLRAPPLVSSRSDVKVVDVCRPRSKYLQFLSGTVYVEVAVSCR